MKSFRDVLREQLCVGTRIALTGGLLLGLLLGILLVTLENIQLILPGFGTRLLGVVFLTSSFGLLLPFLFLPLELTVALLKRLWPRLAQRISVPRFYISALVVGIFFVHSFFWIGFNVIRDLKTRGGLIACLSLLAVSFGLFLVANLIPANVSGRERDGSRFGFAAQLLLIFLLVPVAVLSHRLIRPFQQVDALERASLYVPEPADSSEASTKAHPVVLISIDTLRADHVASYGYERPTTPNIDSLLGMGSIFPNFHSQAPWTLPSHATMLTALYPGSHGARFRDSSRFFNSHTSDTLKEWNVTLAELLRAQGFQTAGFTSTIWLSPEFGFDQGFHTFEMNTSHTATAIVDKALAWLEAEEGRPYFLFLHFFDVHAYRPSPEYDELYQDGPYDGILKGQEVRAGSNLFQHLSESDLEYLKGKYDAALTYVDSQLGRVFDWLREAEQYDNALIIVTSDHGEEFWDHGGTGHGFTMYEEQLHVPLIIKPPAAYETKDHAPLALAGVIDIMPTVLDYVGIPPLPFFEGTTLRPLLEGYEPHSRTLFAESTTFQNGYAAVRDNLKFIANRIPPLDLFNLKIWLANLRTLYEFKGDELYHILDDPAEKTNLVEARVDTAAALSAALSEFVRTRRISTQMKPDESTIEKLRSLGYIN